MEKYFAEVIGAFAEKGYEASPGPKLEHYFKAAGFQDVHVEKFRVPLGIWPKSPHLVCKYPEIPLVSICD